jgi:phosphoglycolate phosphatase-like HAD superfamily hydrolase
MTTVSPPLLVFDFDGVIVDGMEEYWWAARAACLALTSAPSVALPVAVPLSFRQLRPWVHHGLEMVVLAAQLLETEGPLQRGGVEAYAADYTHQGELALARRGWRATELQQALEQVRRQAVALERAAWLQRHSPFPGVVERLRRLEGEGVSWAVLTTKGAAFTAELLKAFSLQPARLLGHEAGPKPQVLLQLQQEWMLCGFVEDRRATLETVRMTPGLERLPCFLASWGYLRPSDRQGLPDGIGLLEPDRFAAPLAAWG